MGTTIAEFEGGVKKILLMSKHEEIPESYFIA